MDLFVISILLIGVAAAYSVWRAMRRGSIELYGLSFERETQPYEFGGAVALLVAVAVVALWLAATSGN